MVGWGGYLIQSWLVGYPIQSWLGEYPIQSWSGLPHLVMVMEGRGYLIQSWWGVTLGTQHTPRHPDLAGGTPWPDLGWGTPCPDLVWGTPPVQTWDGVPPPSRPGWGVPWCTPSQTWDGVPPCSDLVWGTPPIQTWDGVPPPSRPGWGGYPRYPLPHPDLGWGTPHPDLGWGTPSQTWDVPPPARPGMGYPPQPGTGYPPRGVDWQTNWKQYLAPSFGKNIIIKTRIAVFEPAFSCVRNQHSTRKARVTERIIKLNTHFNDSSDCLNSLNSFKVLLHLGKTRLRFVMAAA